MSGRQKRVYRVQLLGFLRRINQMAAITRRNASPAVYPESMGIDWAPPSASGVIGVIVGPMVGVGSGGVGVNGVGVGVSGVGVGTGGVGVGTGGVGVGTGGVGVGTGGVGVGAGGVGVGCARTSLAEMSSPPKPSSNLFHVFLNIAPAFP